MREPQDFVPRHSLKARAPEEGKGVLMKQRAESLQAKGSLRSKHNSRGHRARRLVKQQAGDSKRVVFKEGP